MTNEQLLELVWDAADSKKAVDLIALDLKGVSLIADYFVICHGNSETQVQAIATEIRKKAESQGARVRGTEGMDKARWVLIDLGRNGFGTVDYTAAADGQDQLDGRAAADFDALADSRYPRIGLYAGQLVDDGAAFLQESHHLIV
jgi:ribosome-associated protein